MCQGLNSHYFHIIGDGHQPNSRGLHIHYKDSLLKVGGLPSPIQGVDRPWHRWFQRCFCSFFFDFYPEGRGTWFQLEEFFLLNWLENHLEISSSNIPLEVWKPMKTWQLGDSYLIFWAYTPYTYYISIIYPIYTYLMFGLFLVY